MGRLQLRSRSGSGSSLTSGISCLPFPLLSVPDSNLKTGVHGGDPSGRVGATVLHKEGNDCIGCSSHCNLDMLMSSFL